MKRIYIIIIAFSISLSAMAQQMVGEIRVFAGNYAPQGWLMCNGQTVSIGTYSMLFSLIGTTYGGDGISTFALPNLCGRVPVGIGQGTGLQNYPLGSTGGSTTITYAEKNLPPHTHTVTLTTGNDAGNADTPVNTLPATTNSMAYSPESNTSMAYGTLSVTVGSTGTGSAQNNMQPYTGINYIIAEQGLYQMADDPYLGEIRLYVGSTVPNYWLPCDGRSLPVMSNSALYSLLGNSYGGNSTNFNIPDLRGRVPVSQGTSSGMYPVGNKGGEETQILTSTQMTLHTHSATAAMQVYSGVGDSNTPNGTYPAVNPQRGNEFTGSGTNNSVLGNVNTYISGAGFPVSNIQPYCALQYIICTQGIFPSRP